MGKKLKLLALCLGLSLMLSGCFMRTVDEMYAIPQPPEEYQNLDAKIQEVKTALGAEYAAPLSGRDTQPIQLQDLDGDGEQESAVAFFRVPSGEKPLKIYIFTRQPDDSYITDCILQGDGSAIFSVSYEDLGGTPAKEMVVSWQMSANVHTLAAYSLVSTEAVELMRTSYTKFRVLDMDMDNKMEILALQIDTTQEGASRCELYDYDGTTMILQSTAPLSAGVTEIKSANSGFLRDSVPALFACSAYMDEKNQIVDIFALKDGQLQNIVLDAETGMSREIMRYYVMGTQDINGDGILELPQAEALPEYDSPALAPNYWMLHWRQYDLDGKAYEVFSTYHNVTDGWYIVLPDWWYGGITVSRRDLSSTGERRMVFSRWNGETKEPIDFLTIYTLTGANRASRAAIGNRQPLLEDVSTIYACEFAKDGWDCGLDKDGLLERFHLIRTAWSSEN
ncbi:MAG: hypothetical protein RR828_04920 [Oscillospiraceae bacterium]